jgi:hypothetical protein
MGKGCVHVMGEQGHLLHGMNVCKQSPKRVHNQFSSPSARLLNHIMLIGRWSRPAFLKMYIRKQVQEFSFGISSKMIEVQSFKHINTSPLTTNTTDSIVGDLSLLLMGMG